MPAVGLAVANTGAQMDVVSVATIQSMGLDTSSLVPVRARVFGPSRGAEIKMKGGILLKVGPSTGDGLSTIRLFYVAESVNQTYLSLATLKAQGIVPPDFPRIPTLQLAAASHSNATGHPGDHSVPGCTR